MSSSDHTILQAAPEQIPGSLRADSRVDLPQSAVAERRHFGWIDVITRLKVRCFTALVRKYFGACGKHVTICPPLRFANLNRVYLGNEVIINRDSWIHTLTRQDDGITPTLVIKSHTSIGMGATIAAVQRVILGTHVLLARNVYISDHGHAFEDITCPIMFQGIRGISPVYVGDHTWIGQNACVLPGVRIGKHCVIGANSVVTKDVPDYSVAVGMPARVIKHYNQEKQRWEQV